MKSPAELARRRARVQRVNAKRPPDLEVVVQRTGGDAATLLQVAKLMLELLETPAGLSAPRIPEEQLENNVRRREP